MAKGTDIEAVHFRHSRFRYAILCERFINGMAVTSTPDVVDCEDCLKLLPSVLFSVPSNWKIDFENQNSNFRSQLFDMIRRADDDNMEKLRAGFPAEVAVYEAWMANLVGEFPAQVTI